MYAEENSCPAARPLQWRIMWRQCKPYMVAVAQALACPRAPCLQSNFRRLLVLYRTFPAFLLVLRGACTLGERSIGLALQQSERLPRNEYFPESHTGRPFNEFFLPADTRKKSSLLAGFCDASVQPTTSERVCQRASATEQSGRQPCLACL